MLLNSIRNKLGWRLLLPVRFAKRLLQIKRSPLPTSLKRAIARTEATLCMRLLCRHVRRPVECRILNFNVRAYSLSSLDFLFDEIFVNLEYFFETDKDTPFIIDCGSNIGLSIMFFKSVYPRATIVGFEPALDSFTLLRQNIALNQLPEVTVHQAAVGESSGKITLYQEQEPGSFVASTDPRRASGRVSTVEQMCLSDFVDREVDFLKLDVEGAEQAVFRNLVTSGCIRKIRQMVVEYHHHLAQGTDVLSESLAELERHGFGYLLKSDFKAKKRQGEFQDVLIYAYRKGPPN